MAAYTINVAPYVDLGYVEGGYLDDAFFIALQEALLRDTDGLRTQTAHFVLGGISPVVSSIRKLYPAVRSHNLLLRDAAVNAQFFERTNVTPFQLSPFDTGTTAQRSIRSELTTFLLRGFPIGFGDAIRPFIEGTPSYTDFSDQSKDFEALRRSYGGSDNASPFFTRPQYVRWNSISKSRDFGIVRTLDAQVTGKIGTEVGSPTVFLKAECSEPARLRITKLPASNRYDDRAISVGILDSQRKAIPLNDEGFAFPVQTDSERLAATDGNTQQNFEFLPAGIYFFTVTSSQWRSADFGVEISIGGTIQLAGTITGESLPTLRISASYLSGAADLVSDSYGNLVVEWELEGIAEGTLQPSLALTRTSPYSTN